MYLPIAGEVVEANEALADEPGLVNSSPFENGWFVKVRITDPSAIDGMMDEAAYKEHCAKS